MTMSVAVARQAKRQRGGGGKYQQLAGPPPLSCRATFGDHKLLSNPPGQQVESGWWTRVIVPGMEQAVDECKGH
jgi:hypothetical protein